jgi:hypothetical protein
MQREYCINLRYMFCCVYDKNMIADCFLYNLRLLNPQHKSQKFKRLAGIEPATPTNMFGLKSFGKLYANYCAKGAATYYAYNRLETSSAQDCIYRDCQSR